MWRRRLFFFLFILYSKILSTMHSKGHIWSVPPVFFLGYRRQELFHKCIVHQDYRVVVVIITFKNSSL